MPDHPFACAVMCACALLAGVTAAGAQGPTPAERFLHDHGAAAPGKLTVEALDTFLSAEAAYSRKDYAGTAAILDALWSRHPAGTDEWATAYREGRDLGRTSGINIGCPPCYYALRMLTECAHWRAAGGREARPISTAVLTVVLVGETTGIEPTSRAELAAGTGRTVTHKLEPLLLKDGSRVIHQSLWLFREYMLAATGGRLRVETRIAPLKDLSVPVRVVGGERLYAGLADGAWERIWAAVPANVKAATDWWWVLYPSNIPEQYADFARTEFVTGGMGSGPDGASPCFIIDDRWLTRKPPHLGSGPYTDVERRAYLPQWLQHEFYHHLFRIYPQFGLETKGHQWFDRKTWPADFTGRIEPDYYAEALHKRLQPEGEPPMHVRLRYAPPPERLFAGIRAESLVGAYRHEPVQNDWHVGRISIEPASATDKAPVLRWTNQAGRSWRLVPDLAHGLLKTGPDNPYYADDRVTGRAFRLVLRRDAAGNYLAEVAGFQFGGGFYARE